MTPNYYLPPKRGRDGRPTRERISSAALQLFAEKGFDGTSVRDIARAAGIAEGALYRHFASKEALARSLFLDGYARLAADIGGLCAAVPGFPGRVASLVAHFCRLFDEEPTLFSFLLLNQHDHLRFVDRHDDAANVVSALERVFVEAIASGEIPPQDAALATALALGTVAQPAVFHLYGRLGGKLEDRAETITTAVLRVVGAIAIPSPAAQRPAAPHPRVRAT
jgi:AcrR family transcriptional regulator